MFLSASPNRKTQNKIAARVGPRVAHVCHRTPPPPPPALTIHQQLCIRNGNDFNYLHQMLSLFGLLKYFCSRYCCPFVVIDVVDVEGLQLAGVS